MNTKVKKGIDIGAIVLFCIVFILGIFTVTIMITTKTTGVPSIFGYAFVDIQTPSMEGTLDVHDVAVIKICDVKKDNAGLKGATGSDVKNLDGSILTFWDDTITEDGSKVLNTHMIVEILYNTTGDPNSGIMAFRTQGTANENEDLRLRLPEDVVGVYTGTRLAGFGNFTNFLQSWYGFLILIVLPLTAFLVWRIVILVKTAKEYKAEVNVEKEGTIENLEAQLAALKAQLSGGAEQSGATPTSTVDETATQGGALSQWETSEEKPEAPVEKAQPESEKVTDTKPEEAVEEQEPKSEETAAEEVKPEETAAEEVKPEETAEEVEPESEKASDENALDTKPEETAEEQVAESGEESAKSETVAAVEPSQEVAAPKAAEKAASAKKTEAKPAASKTSTSKTTAAKTTAKSSTSKATAAKTSTAKSAAAKTTASKTSTSKTTAAKTTAKSSTSKATAAKTSTAKSAAKTTTKTAEAADTKDEPKANGKSTKPKSTKTEK